MSQALVSKMPRALIGKMPYVSIGKTRPVLGGKMPCDLDSEARCALVDRALISAGRQTGCRLRRIQTSPRFLSSQGQLPPSTAARG